MHITIVILRVSPLEQNLLVFKLSYLLFIFSRFLPYLSLLLTKPKTLCSSSLFFFPKPLLFSSISSPKYVCHLLCPKKNLNLLFIWIKRIISFFICYWPSWRKNPCQPAILPLMVHESHMISLLYIWRISSSCASVMPFFLKENTSHGSHRSGEFHLPIQIFFLLKPGSL